MAASSKQSGRGLARNRRLSQRAGPNLSQLAPTGPKVGRFRSPGWSFFEHECEKLWFSGTFWMIRIPGEGERARVNEPQTDRPTPARMSSESSPRKCAKQSPRRGVTANATLG